MKRTVLLVTWLVLLFVVVRVQAISGVKGVPPGIAVQSITEAVAATDVGHGARAPAAAASQFWAESLGGQNWEEARAVAISWDGSSLVGGTTRSFGAGLDDAWVVKLDDGGGIVWQYTYGNAGNDKAYYVCETLDGGYVLAGHTDSSGAGSEDAWVLKASASGAIQWQRTYGGTGSDGAGVVERTGDGGYVVLGSTQSFPIGSRNVWVLKTDSVGQIQWQKAYGGLSSDGGSAIDQTFDGGYIVAGTTTSFGQGGADFWVFRLDPAGGVLWQKSYGGHSDDIVYSVIQTLDGGYAVAGYTLSFGAGDRDVWVLKLDSVGGIEWQETLGGTVPDGAYSMVQAADGGYVVAGNTYSWGSGLRDVWILKLDEAGTVEWQRTYGGGASERAHSIRPAPDGGYVVAGFTRSFSQGEEDVWVMKVDEMGSVAGCPLVSASAASPLRTFVQDMDTGAYVYTTNAVTGDGIANQAGSAAMPYRQCYHQSTPTATPTATPSPSPSATWTPTLTVTPSPSPTSTWTPTPTPTVTPSPTATPLGEPDLSASTKGAAPEVIGCFDEVTYTIVLRNTGTGIAQISLSDAPPLPYKGGSAVGGIWWDDEAGAIRWEGTLAVNESRLFQFQVFGPVPPIPYDTLYTNEALVDDGIHTPVVLRASVLVNPRPTDTPTPTPSPTATASPVPMSIYLPVTVRSHSVPTATPTATPIPWSRSGLGGQEVVSLALHPTNPALAYAGTYENGVYRRASCREAWRQIGLEDQVGAVVAPTSGEVVYAGAWGGGVFKSSDGGDSWDAVNSGLDSLLVYTLAVHPNNPQVVYAGTGDAGVFKTGSGGSSWQAMNQGLDSLEIRALSVDPTNPATVYAGTADMGVYQSVNGGQSWEQASDGLQSTEVWAVAVHPAEWWRLYAGTTGGVYSSDSQASAWMQTGLTAKARSLLVDPTDPDRIRAGTWGDGVFCSDSGGTVWGAANEGLDDLFVAALAMDPELSGTLYAGTKDGVWERPLP